MKISIVTDEVSSDPETAIELISDWGIKYVEIRGVWNKRVPDIDSFEVKRLKEIIASYGVSVIAISPGVYKCRISDNAIIMNHLRERLPRSIELARELGTNIIIIFGFIQDSIQQWEKQFSRAVEFLRETSNYAAKEDVILALENEPAYIADTGERAANLVKSVQNDNLRVNWDPCNAYVAGEQASAGYEYVRDLVVHVHLKDAIIDNKTGRKTYVPLGEGEVGIFNQVERLAGDGYKNFLSIETHIGRNKVKNTLTCLRNLQLFLKEIGGEK
jgi:sugar phosphate isomerase/epimerase